MTLVSEYQSQPLPLKEYAEHEGLDLEGLVSAMTVEWYREQQKAQLLLAQQAPVLVDVA
jgi:hypothetical protein